jgi:hypothetical protein
MAGHETSEALEEFMAATNPLLVGQRLAQRVALVFVELFRWA